MAQNGLSRADAIKKLLTHSLLTCTVSFSSI